MELDARVLGIPPQGVRRVVAGGEGGREGVMEQFNLQLNKSRMDRLISRFEDQPPGFL